jgi:hypothetical protein
MENLQQATNKMFISSCSTREFNQLAFSAYVSASRIVPEEDSHGLLNGAIIPEA